MMAEDTRGKFNLTWEPPVVVSRDGKMIRNLAPNFMYFPCMMGSPGPRLFRLSLQHYFYYSAVADRPRRSDGSSRLQTTCNRDDVVFLHLSYWPRPLACCCSCSLALSFRSLLLCFVLETRPLSLISSKWSRQQCVAVVASTMNEAVGPSSNLRPFFPSNLGQR